VTALLDPARAPIETLSRPALPRLRVIVARAMVSLTTAVVAPTVLFAATLVAVDVKAAVTVALAWVAGATFWRWATGRPVSGLLMLTLGIMTVRTGFTLATGNTFAYFVQPVVTDATVATIFLGSLLTTRPIVARIAPDFYPIDAPLAARPGMRRLFRRLTLLWGLVIVVKASVTLSLLLSLSTVHYVMIQSSTIIVLMLTATAVTITLSTIVGRQEGLFHTAA
jgi:hypothetical protein